uniref:AIRS domain-containing protein n=1 Tax=Haemonchus placei TaxID=6290 RepID=A0A0N4WV70_HAEPC
LVAVGRTSTSTGAVGTDMGMAVICCEETTVGVGRERTVDDLSGGGLTRATTGALCDCAAMGIPRA